MIGYIICHNYLLYLIIFNIKYVFNEIECLLFHQIG